MRISFHERYKDLKNEIYLLLKSVYKILVKNKYHLVLF